VKHPAGGLSTTLAAAERDLAESSSRIQHPTGRCRKTLTDATTEFPSSYSRASNANGHEIEAGTDRLHRSPRAGHGVIPLYPGSPTTGAVNGALRLNPGTVMIMTL